MLVSMKKITEIERTEDGSGYVIFFNDGSKAYASKHDDMKTPCPDIHRSPVKIIYKGREYTAKT